jgi:hypothetical protein
MTAAGASLHAWRCLLVVVGISTLGYVSHV